MVTGSPPEERGLGGEGEGGPARGSRPRSTPRGTQVRPLRPARSNAPAAALLFFPFLIPERSWRRDVVLLLRVAAHSAPNRALLEAHATRLQGLRRGRHRARGRG